MNRSLEKFIILLFILFIGIAATPPAVNDDKTYIKTIIKTLSTIESASYYNTLEAWAPGATAPTFKGQRFTREYRNRLDSTIGASFVDLSASDTSRFLFCYNGHMKAVSYGNPRNVKIDSFNTRKLPFRPIACFQRLGSQYSESVVQLTKDNHL